MKEIFKIMTPAYLAPISHWAQIINGEIIWDIYQNFNKQTLRNRTFIHSHNGVLKLTIPIKHSKKKFILLLLSSLPTENKVGGAVNGPEDG